MHCNGPWKAEMSNMMNNIQELWSLRCKHLFFSWLTNHAEHWFSPACGSQDLVLDAIDTYCVEGGTLISSRSSCNVRCAITFCILLWTISWMRCAMSCGLCAFVTEHFSAVYVYVLFVPCQWVSQWQTIVWWAVSGGGGGCNHIAIHEHKPCSWKARDDFPLPATYVYHKPNNKAKWAVKSFV